MPTFHAYNHHHATNPPPPPQPPPLEPNPNPNPIRKFLSRFITFLTLSLFLFLLFQGLAELTLRPLFLDTTSHYRRRTSTTKTSYSAAAPPPPPLALAPNPNPNPIRYPIPEFINDFIGYLIVFFFLYLFFLGLAALVLRHLVLVTTSHYRRRTSTTTQQDLPSLQYSSLETTNDCVICLESFKHGDWLKTLPACNHMFHANCVAFWLSIVPNCPVCRTRVALNSGW